MASLSSFHSIIFRLLLTLALGLFVLGPTSCGSGSSSSSGGQTSSTPDFSLSVSPTSGSLSQGGSVSVSLSSVGVGGFSSTINVAVSGVPGGVTVSPASITLTPGKPLQVTFAASTLVVSANQTIMFAGTSGDLTHSTQFNLSLSGTFNPASIRTRYLRTDATTDYFEWINQHWIVYDSTTARYFVADPSMNQIIVVDGTSKKKIASIGVPGAFGIDETPDHTTLYVGTDVGDVYTVDVASMTVTQRYVASQIGPYGFWAYTALVLADGQLALVGGPSNPSIGQSLSVAIWNPADNSITNYGENGVHQSLAFPCPVFAGTIAGFTLSADRTQIVLGIGELLCEFNPSTGDGVYNTTTPLELVALYHITITPDGKYVILANNLLTLQPAVADVFDAATLNEVAQFSVLGDTSSASGFFVSSDSTTLFTPSESIVYAYNLSSQQLVGWVPNIFVRPDFLGAAGASGPIDNPYFLVDDGTGLFAGPLGQGLGFLDTSVLQTGPVGTQFQDGSLSPATGPSSGGTTAQWTDESPIGPVIDITFASQQASAISGTSGSFNLTTISATTPPGPAGPADVYVFTADGGMQLLPEGFSYGPTILEATPNTSTAEGGGTGIVYGYGFGPTSSDTIPASLQISVGGSSAAIIAFESNASDLAYPPFPLQAVEFTIPPGASGSSANLVVSTAAGSASLSDAISFLPAIQQFPLAGATLAQGIYDSYAGLYYFTDTNRIQVFSRAQGAWLNPISIPGAQRLWGIALSPDGSKMAISDLQAGNIYVIDPAIPTSVTTFFVGSSASAGVTPCGLAISDSGNVYYMTQILGQGNGPGQFLKLNTNSGAILNYLIDGPGLGQYDSYLRDLISADNSRVFFNELGYVFYIETATDTIVPANIYIPCCYIGYGNYDMSLSSNQEEFQATGYSYDFNLNAQSSFGLNDRESLNIAYVYGAKLSPDGVLFFQPSTNGIDVFDANIGNLLERISLPVALSANYDALVSDGTDNVLAAITGTGDGIAVVDLTAISEPARSSFARELGPRIPLSGERNRKPNRDVRQSGPIPGSRRIPHVIKIQPKSGKLENKNTLSRY